MGNVSCCSEFEIVNGQDIVMLKSQQTLTTNQGQNMLWLQYFKLVVGYWIRPENNVWVLSYTWTLFLCSLEKWIRITLETEWKKDCIHYPIVYRFYQHIVQIGPSVQFLRVPYLMSHHSRNICNKCILPLLL